MTDPLSICASIAGLVNLADLVFSRAYKYVKGVKNASKDVKTLSSEIGALYGILCNLRLVSDQLEDENVASTLRAEHIYSCYRTLERIKSILEKNETKSLYGDQQTALRRNLRWPFTSQEVKGLICEIERHKATLGLALNVDGMLGLLRALSQQNDLNEGIKDITIELKLRREAETRIAIDKKREKVLDSFGCLDPRKNLDMARKQRHPATGFWLIDSPEFKLWLDTDHVHLWLYGIPGSGKTILSSLVIDEVLLRSSPDIAIAFFFCDYKSPATQQPCQILGCLVQQLAKQDEQSFAKVKNFYDSCEANRKVPGEYEPEDLCNLIINIAENYDCTMIIVDGLDECGTNARYVTELLENLSIARSNANIKTLFLSRDELDIRQCLEHYPRMSIAAKSDDLKLYVDAEIEKRTRKKLLNIKTTSLKEYIRKRLVEGAEGMFRWVTCQMDYLCELPNDAARRRALNELPRGLNLTYERLLRRVNESNKDVKKLVQRALNWVAHGNGYLTAKGLCEAVSVNIGDTCRNTEAIPNELEVLRWCSSLVQMSVDGSRFEFAHFTVLEYLIHIGDAEDGDLKAFGIGNDHFERELTKVCLTYITFSDFDQEWSIGTENKSDRLSHFPFRKYAVSYWCHTTATCDWDDEQLFSLATGLFHFSKPNAFVSWAYDLVSSQIPQDVDQGNRTALCVAEVSTLHFAAMENLPRICSWLIENGCDVNRKSILGTPLHCALLSDKAFYVAFSRNKTNCSPRMAFKPHETVGVLLEAGADPNVCLEVFSGTYPPLFLASLFDGWELTLDLLKKGAKVDDRLVDLQIERFKDEQCEDPNDEACEYLSYVFEHGRCFMLRDETRTRVQHYTHRAYAPNSMSSTTKSGHADGTSGREKRCKEISLGTAAEFGRVNAVLTLLDDHSLDIDAVEEFSLLTALHKAVRKDQSEVAQILWKRGASLTKVDCAGRNALHHSINQQGCRCLSFLLQQDPEVSTTDNENLTVWHLAALGGNVEALKILIDHSKSFVGGSNTLASINGNSLVSCASQSGSALAVSLLLDAGYCVLDVDCDGYSALHHAAKSGSLDTISLLLSQGLDITQTTNDGSTVIHCAVAGNSTSLDVALDLLIDYGIDPFLARKDEITPIELVAQEREVRSNGLTRTSALKRLAGFSGSSQGKREALDRALIILCQRRPSRDSAWLPTGLNILLESGANIMHITRTGMTAFADLSNIWKEKCLELSAKSNALSNSFQSLKNREPLMLTSTKMMLNALKYVPSQSPPHNLFVDPKLLCVAMEVLTVRVLDQVTKDTVDCLVGKLLKHSPDVDQIISDTHDTLIKFACRECCNMQTFEKLLQLSSALSDETLGSDLVREACWSCDDDNRILLKLLKVGFDPNGFSKTGRTALMNAARMGNVRIIKTLLFYGSDVSIRDKAGRSPAHDACSRGYAGILDVLGTLKDTNLDWGAKATMTIRHRCQDVTVLHLAAKLDNDSALKYLLGHNLVQDINCVTDRNETALFIAACFQKSRNVALLLSENADPTVMAQAVGETPQESAVHVAARSGNVEVFSKFLDHGCDLRVRNGEGLDCEMIAWKYGHTYLARCIWQRIHESKQDRDSYETADIPRKREEALRALRVGIQVHDVALCKRIVQGGVDLNAKYSDSSARTPLIHSLQEGQQSIAEHLALEGACPSATYCKNSNPLGYSAFHYAAISNCHKIFRVLLDRHPKEYLRLVNPVHPLHLAVIHQAIECIELMVGIPKSEEEFPSKISYDYYRSSIRHLANLRVKEAKDDQLAEEYRLDTPLHIATSTGNQKIARRLLEVGGLVNEQARDGFTPLHIAADRSDAEMIRLLLDFGANPRSQDWQLRTPAMIAAMRGGVDILRVLTKGGADLCAKDAQGFSALHWAADYCSTVFSYLATATSACNLAEQTKDGYSAMTIAFGRFKSSVSTLLSIAPSPAAYDSKGENLLAAVIADNPCMTRNLMKMLLKRIPKEILPTLLRRKDHLFGTPLYAACILNDNQVSHAVVDLLLDAGADLETDSCDFGTVLMGACAAGRLEAVKVLVYKGAKMIYTINGQTFSALKAARPFS